MSDKKSKIVALSMSSTSPILPYVFVPVGKLIVEIERRRDTSFSPLSVNIEIGETYYMNTLIEFNGCVKVGEWIFCLERNKALDNSKWVIGAFNGNFHCSFVALETEENMRHCLVDFIVTMILPILTPEAFSDVENPEDNKIKYRWKLQPLT